MIHPISKKTGEWTKSHKKMMKIRGAKIRREFEKLAADVLFTALVFAIGGMILRSTNTNKHI